MLHSWLKQCEINFRHTIEEKSPWRMKQKCFIFSGNPGSWGICKSYFFTILQSWHWEKSFNKACVLQLLGKSIPLHNYCAQYVDAAHWGSTRLNGVFRQVLIGIRKMVNNLEGVIHRQVTKCGLRYLIPHDLHSECYVLQLPFTPITTITSHTQHG